MDVGLKEVLQIASVVISIVAVGVTVFVGYKVKELHVIVNSRLSQLLEVTAKASRAEGRAERDTDANDH